MASSPPSEHRSKKHRFRAFMAQPMRQSKSGIYYLRRKVPAELREALGREYKRSLKTQDANEAKARHAAEWIESDRVFALARAQVKGEATYSRADAQQLAARWFRAEQERMDQAGEFTPALAADAVVSIELGDFKEEHAVYETMRAVADRDGNLNALRRAVQDRLERAMRREGLPIPPKASGSVGRGMRRAASHH